MCGICGIIGKPFDGNGKIFSKMLIDNMERGTDATGIIYKKIGCREIKTYKMPVDAETFLKSELTIPNYCNSEYLLGHTRRASMGNPKINKENHPHIYGNWIIIHNGVIYNTDALYRRCRVKKTVECDSAIIPIVFYKYGFESGIKKLDGWFSIVAINILYPDYIYICSNSDASPLYYGFYNHNVIFSSIKKSVSCYTDAERLKNNTLKVFNRETEIESDSFKTVTKPKPKYYREYIERDIISDNLINNFYNNTLWD